MSTNGPIKLEHFFEATRNTDLVTFHPALHQALAQHYEQPSHGRTTEWNRVLEVLPKLDNSHYCFDQDSINVTTLSKIDLDSFRHNLKALIPWRKGPWNLLGVKIDSEWQSDWKWRRLQLHITPLQGRRVLDVGTGNGYFLYRMLGDGATFALGIDPSRLFLYQFQAIQNLLPANNAHILPLCSEHLPPFNYFDTVFSLGVLYHRRAPLNHITELLSFLRPGGELVLETLVVLGTDDTILIPRDRYASMANVWFLPSPIALKNMLRRLGLMHIRIVDINQTQICEQRSTEWMPFHSLPQFLHPDNKNMTLEGYPAPRRAIVIGVKPG